MDQITIVKHIRDGHDLLSLPQTLSEILKEAENPNFTADALAKIILRDPAMTGRILKVANSSFYSRNSSIRTVNQAVQLLGMNTVKCLSLSMSIFRPEKLTKESGIDARQLFNTLLSVGIGAERVARAAGYKHPDEAFIAGLLHDIGIIYLLEYYPTEYRKILDHKVKATQMLDAEKEVFGIDHAEIGYFLATRWCLPEYVCKAIRSHHKFMSLDDLDLMSRCVLFATLLESESFGYTSVDLEDRLHMLGKVAASLNIPPTQISDISLSMLTSAVDIAEHMGVDIGSTEELLTRANMEIWRTYSTIENLFKERQELSSRLLSEERRKGALESKNIAIATLSHYLNNAAMAVYGRSQIIRMMNERRDIDFLTEKLPESLDVIDRSIRKIVAVLAEIKAISPIEELKFIKTSLALNLDERIAHRLKEMEKESGLVLPDEVEEIIKP
jgi:HD-like signal output (HDOD) protein